MAPAKVATPKIVVDDGSGSIRFGQVTLSCDTPDAVIRYTTDGTIPDESSREYTGVLTLARGQTIVVAAKAYKDGIESSDTVSEIINVPLNVEIRNSATIVWMKQYRLAILNPLNSNSTFYYKISGISGSATTQGRLDPGENYNAQIFFSSVPTVYIFKLDDTGTKRIEWWYYYVSGFSVGNAFTNMKAIQYKSLIQLNAPILSNDNGLITISNTFPGEVEHTYYKIDDGEYQEYTEPFQMETSGTVTAYCTGAGYRDSSENSIDVVIPAVGETVTVDDVEVLIIAAKDDAGTWSSTNGAKGVEYIAVDKNHDLSFYVNGDDYVDSSDYDQAPGTFGYEWGGDGTITNITNTEVGTGFTNTLSLILRSEPPNTEGWYVVWDKVNEFRQSHSDKWFVPSKDELNLVYENRAYLSNLSLITNYFYWSSSEGSSVSAWTQAFNSGDQNGLSKSRNDFRVRLCVQFTEDDI